ncbi:MAG: UDP-3-O-(3-hydroxymyristoyl)glucosamine N-acyltransferase [Methanotrichaceae archaeon]
MKLSEITVGSIDVIKDGEFTFVGNINQDKPKQLSFIENKKYITSLQSSPNISCILIREDLVPFIPEGLGVMVSNNPRKSFYEIHNYLAMKTVFYGMPFETVISDSARVHPTAYVSEMSVRIGNRCHIGPNATILENTVLEDDVIIRAGAVIGTEGFRFERIDKEILPVHHVGGVLIHKRAEIQANTCVASAKFGGDSTEIGEDTKIDNLVHIAHNAVIGKRCMIAASAMVAGSAVIGDDVWIGPNACVSNGLTVGDSAFITMGSVVTRNVAPGQKVTGNFAIDHDKFINHIKEISQPGSS